MSADDERLREGAAHDIRNALATVAGWVSLARSGRVPIDEALNAIALATDTATRTADVLLDGATDESAECDLAQCAHDVARLLRPTANERSVRIEVRTSATPIAKIAPSHAARIAWNLALNALQALDAGQQVTLVVEAAQGWAVLRVEDEGPGMDRRTQRAILEHRTSQREGGRGIGLTAVRQLVRDAGGTLSLDSAPGRGTSFRIELPIVVARKRCASGVTERPIRSVLVVEDDAGVRELVATTLSLRGLDVRTLAGRAEASRENGEFDVALIDLTLADGSGRDVIDDLQRRGIAKHFVLMSGMPSEAKNDHGWLRKPFDARQLLGAIGVAPIDATG